MVARHLLTPLFIGLSASAAFAQSNEVYVGQVGNQNKTEIDQTGARNIVGGPSDDLRLNQLGVGNGISVIQVGEDNTLGPLDLVGLPGFLTATKGVASGLYQRGNDNRLIVEQRSYRGSGGGSMIGAVDQSAQDGAPAMSNSATIRQIGGGYDEATSQAGESSGPANHTIAELVQQWAPNQAANGTNVLDVGQFGFDQTIWQLRQVGASNSLSVQHSVRENSLRIARQTGVLNGATLVLSGENNALGIVEQIGENNALDLSLSGDRNFADQILQAGYAKGGGGDNVASVTIVGDDNGGEGIGGYRAMSAQGDRPAGFAASMEQIGDGNQLQLTIGASGTGSSSNGNLYSLSQAGLQNGLVVTMTGDGNETDSRQDGDGNTTVVEQHSDAVGYSREAGVRLGNVAFTTITGDRNGVVIGQSGLSNIANVTVTGSDNDLGTAPLPMMAAFGRTVGGLLSSGIFQSGADNEATVTVIGSSNRAGVFQSGDSNLAWIDMGGDGGSVFIGQSDTE